MKRTLFGLTLAAVILGTVLALLFPGCKPRAKPGGGDSTESDNVLWRNELFDFAIDTLLNRTDEFYTAERQQQTINRLDQWVRLQKPLEGWKPDPVIAGVTEDLQTGTTQLLDLAQRITRLQQGDNTVRLDDMPGEFRSAGERLGTVGMRLALLDILQLGSQMVAMADQVEKTLGENAAAPDQAPQAVRTLFAKFNVEEFERLAAELSLLSRRIDPSMLEFPAMDSTTFQEAVWLRNVASWASGEELDDPVKPAVALFDWVVKNVQLGREPIAEDSNPQTHVFQTPMETLLFGQGTGIDRAWLFVLLARQRNIDAALLGLVDENNNLNRLWGVGVLIEGEIYLFEPVLGVPIPKPGSQKLAENGLTFEPATLAEAASNEAVFQQLDLFKEGDYMVRSKDMQRVVALVEASPSCLSQRMKMVEKRLTGDQKIVLTTDVTAQIERFKQCKHVVDGRMWTLPYQTIWQQIRFAPERNKWFSAKIAPLVFPPQMPILWKARSYHFKGQFTGNPSATMFYLAARQSDFATDSAGMEAEAKQMWREIKIDASYWLGLMVAQTGNYRAAEDYLKTRVLMADPGGKWEQGAAYNLARVAEATGDIPLAIDLLEVHTATPQAQGNVIRAGWLRKLTGQPALKARSDTDPKEKEPEEEKPDDAQEGKVPEETPVSKSDDKKAAVEPDEEEEANSHKIIFTNFVPCLLAQSPHAADPPRMKRADAFFGIHFDFHAGKDCTQVGQRTTRQMVELVIDKVQPDYIQIDCKGHPGYSSYPTKVGNPAPGFVGDPLRVWRDATRLRGVALFMHYSGVWDSHAVATHPEWAAINADGNRNDKATSVFGPYADTLMIPQLRELAGDYGVDGVWVDGDCWATTPDYGETAVREFCKQTGAQSAPRKAGEAYWNEWLDFNREAFRRYVRHYVDELKSSHPDFQVISNWAFSDHMPEPVSANVAGLSGDFSPDDSVNSARFAGRCLENQGVAWDLMSWSFSRKTRKQKPAVQLMQEAAIVLAMGGGYQAYFKQDRDGALRDPSEMDVMAEVARFCRDRQAWCHHSVAVPQIALLYSTAGHYRQSPRLFHWAGSSGVAVLRQALTQILQNHYGVQILSEHHLKGKMSQWPVIIVPGWDHLEPDFRNELADYAKSGGKLLLIGPGPAKLFEAELKGKTGSAIESAETVDDAFASVLARAFPSPMVEVAGAKDLDISPRTLSGKLSVHLVNTSGPHADAPDGGITKIEPAGPLTVSIRLEQAPKSITMQPEGKSLDVAWAEGCASVTVTQLDLYSILVVEP